MVNFLILRLGDRLTVFDYIKKEAEKLSWHKGFYYDKNGCICGGKQSAIEINIFILLLDGVKNGTLTELDAYLAYKSLIH